MEFKEKIKILKARYKNRKAIKLGNGTKEVEDILNARIELNRLLKICIKILLIIIIVGSICYIMKYFIEKRKENESNQKMQNLFEDTENATNENQFTDDFINETNNMLTENSSKICKKENIKTNTYNLENIKKVNDDVVGWIKIDETNINYPVLQNKNDSNYYLHKNIYKNDSSLGSIYTPNYIDINNTDNILLYGHHIKAGLMFANLTKYSNYKYYQNHKIIKFMKYGKDTFEEYEIFATFKTTGKNGFDYYNFYGKNSKEQYEKFVKKCKSMSFYDTGITAYYEDKLLTLSTCEYSQKNGRMVIVARKI